MIPMKTRHVQFRRPEHGRRDGHLDCSQAAAEDEMAGTCLLRPGRWLLRQGLWWRFVEPVLTICTPLSFCYPILVRHVPTIGNRNDNRFKKRFTYSLDVGILSGAYQTLLISGSCSSCSTAQSYLESMHEFPQHSYWILLPQVAFDRWPDQDRRSWEELPCNPKLAPSDIFASNALRLRQCNL